MEDIHTKILIYLFDNLADKETNIINGNNLDMSEIPEKIRNILMPLMEELKSKMKL